jgi:hypothetical protein
MAVASSRRDEYDEYDAKVRVPKGEKLAQSRVTPGAHRGFTHSGDRKMEHAEIFLKSEGERDEPESDNDPAPVFRSDPAVKSKQQQEVEELLQALVKLGMLKAVEWASPHVKRLWHEQARPHISARWERLRHRHATGSELEPAEPPAIIEAAPADVEDVSTTLEAYQVSITSDEARAHFVQALLARRFADEKLRFLDNARIEDSAAPPELLSAVEALTPKQVEEVLTAMLTANPHLLEDLWKLLEVDRSDVPLRLGSDQLEQALRLSQGEL